MRGDIESKTDGGDAVLAALGEIAESASLLAHEIKNPITAVSTALRAVGSALGEDEQEVLDDLVARMRGLERRLRRCLEYARPLEPDLRPVPLREVTGGAADLARDELEGAGCSVEVSGADPTVRLDPAILSPALAELLVNAARAGAGRVEVRIEALGPGGAVVEVDDDGRGVDPAVRPRAFAPLASHRADADGMGLALCRKAVEVHGGGIELVAGRLGGTCLRVALPSGGAN